jgi:hypothetical protein
MQRRLATLAAASALMLAFALGASPALAGAPAQHMSVDATQNDPVVCGLNVYTIVSGTLAVTYRFGGSASGNTNATQTWTARDIVVRDQDLTSYRAVGAIHLGARSNATTGGFQQILMWKLQIVGTADSINLVMRFSPNGDFSAFGPGTCSP